MGYYHVGNSGTAIQGVFAMIRKNGIIESIQRILHGRKILNMVFPIISFILLYLSMIEMDEMRLNGILENFKSLKKVS